MVSRSDTLVWIAGASACVLLVNCASAPPAASPPATHAAATSGAPEGTSTASGTPNEAPVDLLAAPARSGSLAAPSVAGSTPPPAPRPLDPPCKLVKGASRDAPWEPPRGEAVIPNGVERSAFGLPTPLPAPLPARISPEVVQRPIRERFSCFRGCYQRGLARKPALAGRIIVDFTITAGRGTVKSVADRGSTLPDPDVIACVLEEMKQVRFPPPGDKDVRILYPIEFAPPLGP